MNSSRIIILAKKKDVIFKNDLERIGRNNNKKLKISDALQAPEHVMLNFCQSKDGFPSIQNLQRMSLWMKTEGK